MIIGQYFVQFEFYIIYMKIKEFTNVNLYFLFVIPLTMVLCNNNMETKLDNYKTSNKMKI